MNSLRPFLFGLSATAALFLPPACAHAQWDGYAGNAQHTALSEVASLPFDGIRWTAPVDDSPPSGTILIHYGTPVITQENTIIIPVRTAAGGFRIDARNAADGSTLWGTTTDYILPPSQGGWVPSMSPALTPEGTLYYQGIGGTVYRVDDPNNPAATPVQMSFLLDYASHKAAYDSSVYISTPITSDAAGNIYFGFEVSGSAPGGLKSGIARIGADGVPMYVSVNAASGIPGASNLRLGTNAAPALSSDGSTLYVAINGSTDYLAAIDSATLAPLHHVGLPGTIIDASSASPTVGPNGDVFFGILYGYHYRGTLQHFSADLSESFAPGSFGWDDTASIVPASMVPSYTGLSPYLLMVKYNDYKQAQGTGINKLAILDPMATQIDPQTGQPVMKEVLTIAGVTPDADATHPLAVSEWCVNTAVVDPATNSVLVNSEDGILYRWNLVTNTFTESIQLQSTGTFEAYTPTLIGPDGTTYAINKAELFAVGIPEPHGLALLALGVVTAYSQRRRRA